MEVSRDCTQLTFASTHLIAAEADAVQRIVLPCKLELGPNRLSENHMAMIMRFWWLSLIALSACFSPQLDSGVISCGPNDSCPPGFQCNQGVCTSDNAQRFAVTVTSQGNGAGTVTSEPGGIDCGVDCAESFASGTVVTLTATPASGSQFLGWTGACSGTGACTVTVSSSINLAATFALANSLIVMKTGAGTGRVLSDPAGITCGTDCSEQYPPGTMVELTAIASSGSVFDGWSGEGCTGIGACVVTLNAAKQVMASFSPVKHALTVITAGNGRGDVTSAPAGINCGTECEFAFNAGTAITLTAAPQTGSTFTGWTGGGCTGTGTCSVSMSAATSVTATFGLTTHDLMVAKSGSGAGTVTSTPAGISCGADCAEAFDYNTTVTLSASPSTGSTFTGWSGSGCSGTAECTVTMTQAASVTAAFSLNTYTLAVVKSGTGTGTVTSDVAGIACGIDCSGSYPHNTMISLTAAADNGATFSGWSGGGCSGTGTCVVTLAGAASVTATFDLTTHSVQVALAGNGSGTVTGPAISCPGDCSETYPYGTMVTLNATPAPGSTFSGWSGGGCVGSGTCVIDVVAAAAVTATFALNNYPLTVTKTGTGSGSVTSAPAGIGCGADCTELYGFGQNITLTATADPGSTFGGWSGGAGTCSGNTNPCVVTISAAATVTATFTITSHTLTIGNNAGNGGGTVTSNPAGINCGADCAEPYTHGTPIVLTATANPGSIFTGWSGAGCAGTGTCAFNITAATTVTPNFILGSNALTVAKAGNGAGSIASLPAGINCGADCAENFTNGTVVTLTATPAAGSVFAGWSGGGCSGTGTCVVTIGTPLTITANFTLTTHLVSVAKAGNGAGTVTSTSPPGIDCNADCSEAYNYGTVVTLSAAPTPGSTFSGWSGGGCSGTGTCVVTVTAATNVTATFSLIQHTLTVVRAGNGTGSVTSTPAGITCGADCSEPYNNGATVQLTAVAGVGSSFAGWSGGGCSGTGVCALTMTAATSVTATFVLTTHVTTVSVTGPVGAGTVTSSPAGITCPADCTESFNYATDVTLTATPNAGYTFQGWTGAGCTGTGQCTFTVTAATNVTATFAIATFPLTVNRAGNGAALGLVTSSPAGISCGADCSETYNFNTSVTLTATTSPGATFSGWSGGGCTGTGTCVVAMTAARAVTATFTLNRYLLAVSLAGSGSGTVSSSPVGINCNPNCSQLYDHNTVVMLTAADAAGSQFTGWGGACSGASPSCAVTMTQARFVSATFEPIPPNYVFASSTTIYPKMGGLAVADQHCNTLANNAGLPGTYVAYLSTSTVNAVSRISGASGWIRVGDRLPVADKPSDIASEHFFYPIKVDEHGNDIGGDFVMTATHPNGSKFGSTCSDWQDDPPGQSVSAGTASANSGMFTAFYSIGCQQSARIYCFGIDRKAVTSPANQPVRRAFTTQATWVPGGGLASADALCASEAAAALLPGSFKALLATKADSAISRFDTSAGTRPWARPDNTLLSDRASDLTDASLAALLASPNTNAANNVSYGNYAIWTGSSNLATAAGSQDFTCNDWTSSSNARTGYGGRIGDTRMPQFFWFVDVNPCDAGHVKLVCLQE